jgi:hypothetical protein
VPRAVKDRLELIVSIYFCSVASVALHSLFSLFSSRTKEAQEVYEKALFYDRNNPDIYYNVSQFRPFELLFVVNFDEFPLCCDSWAWSCWNKANPAKPWLTWNELWNWNQITRLRYSIRPLFCKKWRPVTKDR